MKCSLSCVDPSAHLGLRTRILDAWCHSKVVYLHSGSLLPLVLDWPSLDILLTRVNMHLKQVGILGQVLVLLLNGKPKIRRIWGMKLETEYGLKNAFFGTCDARCGRCFWKHANIDQSFARNLKMPRRAYFSASIIPALFSNRCLEFPFLYSLATVVEETESFPPEVSSLRSTGVRHITDHTSPYKM